MSSKKTCKCGGVLIDYNWSDYGDHMWYCSICSKCENCGKVGYLIPCDDCGQKRCSMCINCDTYEGETGMAICASKGAKACRERAKSNPNSMGYQDYFQSLLVNGYAS